MSQIKTIGKADSLVRGVGLDLNRDNAVLTTSNAITLPTEMTGVPDVEARGRGGIHCEHVETLSRAMLRYCVNVPPTTAAPRPTASCNKRAYSHFPVQNYRT
ncbi:hypothetical protein J6590_031275 [Homalodisca vitripennis]|nr:hypothetical protein J6590_031275 [Homalodisca vitripennis]